MSEYELEKFEKEIKEKIYSIRGFQVMLDRDLAELYGVETKRLNEAVKRNKERFPEEFCFMLNENEKAEVVAICDHLEKLKFSYNLPYVFTEHGVVMLSSRIRYSMRIMLFQTCSGVPKNGLRSRKLRSRIWKF